MVRGLIAAALALAAISSGCVDGNPAPEEDGSPLNLQGTPPTENATVPGVEEGETQVGASPSAAVAPSPSHTATSTATATASPTATATPAPTATAEPSPTRAPTAPPTVEIVRVTPTATPAPPPNTAKPECVKGTYPVLSGQEQVCIRPDLNSTRYTSCSTAIGAVLTWLNRSDFSFAELELFCPVIAPDLDEYQRRCLVDGGHPATVVAGEGLSRDPVDATFPLDVSRMMAACPRP